MSRDAVASVYTVMLNDEEFRGLVATEPDVLDDWELSDEEKQVVIEEANAEVTGFAIGFGPVMGHLAGPSGPPLSGPIGSALGIALNRSAGLPVRSLTGPGFAMDGGCCPWNKLSIGDPGGLVE